MSIFDNQIYKQSHELAKKEIAGRMTGKKSALTDDINTDDVRRSLNFILEGIALNSNDIDREVISHTAIEFIPFGSFNCEACFPPSEPPFILIDTGTLDFLGNNSTIFCSLLNEPNKYSDQKILDYLFSSALIYFERAENWESRRDALFAPKMNFSQLPPQIISSAFGYSTAFLLFLILHEFAHVILSKTDLQKYNPWKKIFNSIDKDVPSKLSLQYSESMADIVASELIIYYATFGVPKPEMAINILGGVDIGFTFMLIFQGAFPEKQYANKIIKVNEYMDHPAAFQRRIYFRKLVEEKMKLFSERLGLDFLEEGKSCEALLAPYGELIRKGAKPSEEFYYLRELAIKKYG